VLVADLTAAWQLPQLRFADDEPREIRGHVIPYEKAAITPAQLLQSATWFWFYLAGNGVHFEGTLCLDLAKQRVWIELAPEQRAAFLEIIAGPNATILEPS
jgi:hypothetical protein